VEMAGSRRPVPAGTMATEAFAARARDRARARHDGGK
jgi:hypothetical protein